MQHVSGAVMVRSLAAALFFAGSHLATAVVQAQETAVIAGWNIAGVDAIPEERITVIAETIRQIDPDLIVLSEVNPNDAAERIVTELDSDYADPVILEQNDTVVQNIAFIFKDGVSVSNAQLIAGTDIEEEPRSRKALTANVRIGNFDFILIGVHLKSSRDTDSRNMRTRQCEAIAAFIAESVQGDEKDVLVIGDYNMIPRSPDGQRRNDEVNFFALDPDNFLRFVSTDFLNGQTSHIGGCPLSGNLLDGYAISREFTDEYVPGSTRLIRFSELGTNCRNFRRDISDHRPVVSEFSIDESDDD